MKTQYNPITNMLEEIKEKVTDKKTKDADPIAVYEKKVTELEKVANLYNSLGRDAQVEMVQKGIIKKVQYEAIEAYNAASDKINEIAKRFNKIDFKTASSKSNK